MYIKLEKKEGLGIYSSFLLRKNDKLILKCICVILRVIDYNYVEVNIY